MNMRQSKKNIFQNMWIDMQKRKPPDNDTYILGWNTKLNIPVLTIGKILNAQHDQLQSKKIILEEMDNHLYHTGYFVTKWMPIYGYDKIN